MSDDDPGAATASADVDVLVLRDPRESLKKCSLAPLRGMPGIRFAEYRPELRLPVSGRILLDPRGEPLTVADSGRGVLLVDCAWRRVDSLMRCLDGAYVRRRLPRLRSAYPRKSRLFADPEEGLASVEALYAALLLLGRPRADLLDGYRWRDAFLSANPELVD